MVTFTILIKLFNRLVKQFPIYDIMVLIIKNAPNPTRFLCLANTGNCAKANER